MPEKGWAGKTNGELLRLAKDTFDVFITVDQNLEYQQNLRESEVAVILLVVKENRYETLKPLLPKVSEALRTIQKGRFIRIQ